jgi:ABC-2 type transport system permease protein
MKRLLKIEFKKILTYKTFWVLFGLYFTFLSAGILLAEFMINNMVDNMNHHSPIPFPHVTLYYFPDVWQNLAFFASIRFVLIFPAIIIMILITNEFTFRTIRQNIINGMSKAEFIVSKLLIIVIMAAVITIVLGIGAFMIGVSHSGFKEMAVLGKGIPFILGFFVSTLTFLIFAFFLAFILRNTGLSIAIFTLYALIIEPIIYFFLKSPIVFRNKIYTYLPVNTSVSVAEYPAIPVLKKVMGLELQSGVTLTSCLIPLCYSILMIAIVYWVMSKKDL